MIRRENFILHILSSFQPHCEDISLSVIAALAFRLARPARRQPCNCSRTERVSASSTPAWSRVRRTRIHRTGTHFALCTLCKFLTKELSDELPWLSPTPTLDLFIYRYGQAVYAELVVVSASQNARRSCSARRYISLQAYSLSGPRARTCRPWGRSVAWIVVLFRRKARPTMDCCRRYLYHTRDLGS